MANINRIITFAGSIKRLLFREIFVKESLFESRLSSERFKLKLSEYVDKPTEHKFTSSAPFIGEISEHHFKIKYSGDRAPMQIDGEIVPKVEGTLIRLRTQYSFVVYLIYFAFAVILSGIAVLVELDSIIGRLLPPPWRGIVQLFIFFIACVILLKIVLVLMSVDRAWKLRFFEKNLRE